MTPVSKRDVYNILVNPFVDRYEVLLKYARWGVNKDNRSGMAESEIRELLEEVAEKCLELGCKVSNSNLFSMVLCEHSLVNPCGLSFQGRFLKKLYEEHSFLRSVITRLVLEKYQITLQCLPCSDDLEACRSFKAKLCQDFTKPISPYRDDKNNDQEDVLEGDADKSSHLMEGYVDNEPEQIEKNDLTSLVRPSS